MLFPKSARYYKLGNVPHFNAQLCHSARLKLLLTILTVVGVFVLYRYHQANVAFSEQISIYEYESVLLSHADSDDVSKKAPSDVRKGGSYLVDTDGCKIPKLEPFNADFPDKLYTNRTGQRMSCPFPNFHNIKVERFRFSGIRIKKPANVACFSRRIQRHPTDDRKILFANETRQMESVTFFPGEQVVKIECYLKQNLFEKSFSNFSNNSMSKLIFEKVIPLIPKLTPDVTPKVDAPNVILLILDSMSRLNFERHFTLTKQFLTKQGFETMFGYSKVADNTFVNLIPLLTGNFIRYFRDEQAEKNEYFDDMPLLWKKFAAAGYINYYAEDYPYDGTFQYYRKGFLKPPTHYWTRPFALAIEPEIKNLSCYQDQMEIDVHYDLLLDFVR